MYPPRKCVSLKSKGRSFSSYNSSRTTLDGSSCDFIKPEIFREILFSVLRPKNTRFVRNVSIMFPCRRVRVSLSQVSFPSCSNNRKCLTRNDKYGGGTIEDIRQYRIISQFSFDINIFLFLSFSFFFFNNLSMTFNRVLENRSSTIIWKRYKIPLRERGKKKKSRERDKNGIIQLAIQRSLVSSMMPPPLALPLFVFSFSTSRSCSLDVDKERK